MLGLIEIITGDKHSALFCPTVDDETEKKFYQLWHQDEVIIPAPRKRVQKKKPVPKRKATPANKKGKKAAKVTPKAGTSKAGTSKASNSKSGKRGIIVVNGRPVTGEYKPAAKKKLVTIS